MSAENPRQHDVEIRPLTVSVNKACAILGIGRTKMHELMHAGSVKSIRLGKRRLIDYASLEALVKG